MPNFLDKRFLESMTWEEFPKGVASLMIAYGKIFSISLFRPVSFCVICSKLFCAIFSIVYTAVYTI
jgi:hypothetical protein